MRKSVASFLMIVLFSVAGLFAAETERTIAFPTAEGYGKYSLGGRGGRVIEVTNLNDSGTGSFRAAVSESGPRTVVFKVSGNIELKSNVSIRNPYITIAGQTAPGDGICLKGGALSIDADHVIIRHIRVRFGDVNAIEADAVGSRGTKHIILDHVSASWSVDETMSIYACDSITVQWCMITESMYHSLHVKGSHGFGGIWGSNYATYHHNLLAHHSSRNPRMASNAGYTDYRNNVIYNWGYNSCYGGEFHDPYNPSDADYTYINMVNNYYKPGPATPAGKIRYRIVNPSYRNSAEDYGKWYIEGNYMCENAEVTKNNWAGGVQMDHAYSNCRLNSPWPAMPIKEQSATEAFELVVENAGATYPARDVIDWRIADEVIGGYATYEGEHYKQDRNLLDPTAPCGIIDSQEDVGGWPVLQSAKAPEDKDKDGMADAWELEKGLDPTTPNDRNRMHTSGYTALEVYLNELCEEYVEGEFEALPEPAQGEDVAIYWRLGENENFVLSGVENAIIGIEESFSGLRIDRYTSPNSAAQWPAHTGWDATRKTQRVAIIDGAWPGESAYVPDRYVQFGLECNSEKPMLIDSICLYVCGCGTNGMQSNVLISFNEDFSNPTMIADFSTKGSMPNSVLHEVLASPNKLLYKGDKLYLRVYPWTRGAMSNKTICISDLRISGVLLDEDGLEDTLAKDGEILEIYSITGQRKTALTPGLNIVKKAGNKVEKIIIK